MKKNLLTIIVFLLLLCNMNRVVAQRLSNEPLLVDVNTLVKNLPDTAEAGQIQQLLNDPTNELRLVRKITENNGITHFDYAVKRAGKKDPDTAFLISLFVPGGGHIYSGDTKKGLLLLGTAILAPSIGWGISAGSCANAIYDDGIGTCTGIAGIVGSVAAVGAWIYGIVDAKPSVERMNAQGGRRSYSFAPTVLNGANGRMSMGSTFTMKF